MDRASLTRTLTFIQANLDGDLSLAVLSKIANCSPPYFNRCFAGLIKETPKQYTLRLRLERAALRLILMDELILTIALDCGFANPETFCRAFQRHFGLSPRVFRTKGRYPEGVRDEIPQTYAGPYPENLSKTVVRTLQPMHLAFVRHTGPYESVPISLWDPLLQWARRRRLPEPFILLGIARDAPGITQSDRLRFDAAIRVSEEFRSEKLIGYQRFDGGKFAFTTSVGPPDSIPRAYREIFNRILNDRTLVCEGVPCIEFYRVNHIVADMAIVHTEIGVPVRHV